MYIDQDGKNGMHKILSGQTYTYKNVQRHLREGSLVSENLIVRNLPKILEKSTLIEGYPK